MTLDFGPGGRHLVLCRAPRHQAGRRRALDALTPAARDVDGDRLYGLGSGDMKGAVAAMHGRRGPARGSAAARGRLSLLFTADEEDGAAFGAHHVATTRALDADGVVIGEPGGIDDDFDRLHLVSRGIARLRLVARGRQGHSSLSAANGTRQRRGRYRAAGDRRRGRAARSTSRRTTTAWRAGRRRSTPA